MTAPDPVLVAAVADLWCMPRPGSAYRRRGMVDTLTLRSGSA